MAAISEPIAPSAVEKHLRPFDARRDLREVADLVELCFADTLDTDGRDYLARMRSAARETSLLRMAKGWASVPMAGYVWQENHEIIGNVSLIPYLMRGRRYFLIANVAVHPNYRRQGIARQMTEKAIEYARIRAAPAVWLHVREENGAAQSLYASLGFKERAVRTTWLGHPEYQTRGSSQPGVRIVNPSEQHWSLQSAWLKTCYPPELSWHMSFHIDNLRPGLIGMIARFMHNVYLRQWAVIQGGRLAAAATWQATHAHANLIWLAAPENGSDEPVWALLDHIRHHSPTRRTLALDYPARRYGEAIRNAGFAAQQTLVWMTLPLAQNYS